MENYYHELVGVMITWTTYGTWLPGDQRGWRSKIQGNQLPDPELHLQCAEKMKFAPVSLSIADRATVHAACRNHCSHRGWELHAVNARTKHVHVVVSGYEKPQIIRDQLKANCTNALRQQITPLNVERTWTRGGDCQYLFTEEDLEHAVRYVLEAQDGS